MLLLQGVKNAVPKTILQLMNVDGMTRENVASHLLKYRLYLKKLGGYAANAKTSPEALQQVQQVWTATMVTLREARATIHELWVQIIHPGAQTIEHRA